MIINVEMINYRELFISNFVQIDDLSIVYFSHYYDKVYTTDLKDMKNGK